MTFAEMQARVWSALDDDSSDHQRYTSNAVRQYLVDGARLYCATVRPIVQTQTVTQVPGQALYDLSNYCIAVQRVTWVSGGVNYPVSPTTMRELDVRMGAGTGWEDDTSDRAEWYYIFGVDQIGLYPKITSGTNTYTVHYWGDSQLYPFILEDEQWVPDEDREALVAYAVARCLAADRRTADAGAEYAKYAETLKAAKARRSSPDRVTSFGTVAGWQGIGGDFL